MHRSDPRFFVTDGIRVFVQIRVQVGHSGQCQYFISTTSVRSRPFRFLVSVYSAIRERTLRARGNYKDATLFLHVAVATNIFPMNTSALMPQL